MIVSKNDASLQVSLHSPQNFACKVSNRTSHLLLGFYKMRAFHWALEGRNLTSGFREKTARNHRSKWFELNLWNRTFLVLSRFSMLRTFGWELDGRNPTDNLRRKQFWKNNIYCNWAALCIRATERSTEQLMFQTFRDAYNKLCNQTFPMSRQKINSFTYNIPQIWLRYWW